MSLEEQRKFLHDLANPLSVLQGNLRIAVRTLEASNQQNPELVEVLKRLSKAMESSSKINSLLSERRQNLLNQQEKIAG